MDLVMLVTACALAADPKLMHALIWHQSGGEPWAIAVSGEPSPRVFRNMRDAIEDARSGAARGTIRVGLAGIAVPPSKISASVFLPCRNVAMAAVQVGRYAARCKTHPQLKADPMFCAVAVYRGSWAQPDVRFAKDVMASAAKGDAPNFDMPGDTSTEIFDIADDSPPDTGASVIDITATFAEQAKSWSSALFPQKAKPLIHQPDDIAPASAPAAESSSVRPPAIPASEAGTGNRGLFVRRSISETVR